MRHRRHRAALVLMVVCLPVAMFGVFWLGGFRINLTPSSPLGLWRIVPLDTDVVAGDLIFICPPPTPAFMLARERGYVRSGFCPGWMSPLIKTAVALPGQQVDIGDMVTIDGVPLAHSTLRPIDAVGRALPHHQGGTVPAEFLFLHSDFASSYDSRYFGPIPEEGLLGLAQPVLLFAP